MIDELDIIDACGDAACCVYDMLRECVVAHANTEDRGALLAALLVYRQRRQAAAPAWTYGLEMEGVDRMAYAIREDRWRLLKQAKKDIDSRRAEKEISAREYLDGHRSIAVTLRREYMAADAVYTVCNYELEEKPLLRQLQFIINYLGPIFVERWLGRVLQEGLHNGHPCPSCFRAQVEKRVSSASDSAHGQLRRRAEDLLRKDNNTARAVITDLAARGKIKWVDVI